MQILCILHVRHGWKVPWWFERHGYGKEPRTVQQKKNKSSLIWFTHMNILYYSINVLICWGRGFHFKDDCWHIHLFLQHLLSCILVKSPERGSQTSDSWFIHMAKAVCVCLCACACVCVILSRERARDRERKAFFLEEAQWPCFMVCFQFQGEAVLSLPRFAKVNKSTIRGIAASPTQSFINGF